MRHYTRADLKPTDDEPVVSSRIVDGVEDFLKEGDTRFDRYLVTPERPVRDPTRLGKHRRKIDIQIDAVPQRISFTIEAKRLRTHSRCTNAYIGPDGLELFVNGGYAAGDPEAAMIGYVQSETSDAWYLRISEAITADRRGQLHVVEQMRRSPGFTRFSALGYTRHARPEPIDIYHILVDCCGD